MTDKNINMQSTINTLIAETLTPEFVQAEFKKRIDKLIIEGIDESLRSYSDTGKVIKQAINDALKVNSIDLPSYGVTVSEILKSQIEKNVNDLVAGQLSKDMEELLRLAPKEVKLSELAAQMINYAHDDAYGEDIITVNVGNNSYGSRWIYLDEDDGGKSNHDCQHKLLINEDGTIACARIAGASTGKPQYIGRAYGVEQLLRAYVACGTKLIIDEAYVIRGRGDY